MNDSATTVEASAICGCAIHVLKPEQLKAVEALQGSCQKLIEGQIKLAASVNRKGKHFPEESMPGLVFVFDKDPEGILSDLKWLKFPIWICQAGAPDGFSMLMHRHPPPMLCRLGKVSGFSMKAFIWPPAFRAKFPDAPSANPTWIPDANAVGEEDILASLVGSVSELDIAMNMYFGSEMTMSLADCEMELLADQDIPVMRVQGKMMVFGGNRKKLLPEHVCRDAYRKRLERAGWFGSET